MRLANLIKKTVVTIATCDEDRAKSVFGFDFFSFFSFCFWFLVLCVASVVSEGYRYRSKKMRNCRTRHDD